MTLEEEQQFLENERKVKLSLAAIGLILTAVTVTGLWVLLTII